jgi:hypothetical protein
MDSPYDAFQLELTAFQVELDELYQVQVSVFQIDPPFPEKNPIYSQKTTKNPKNF